MNYSLLDKEIEKSGHTYKECADVLNMNLSTFYRKKNGQTSPFSIEHAKILKEYLKLSNKKAHLIFLD